MKISIVLMILISLQLIGNDKKSDLKKDIVKKGEQYQLTLSLDKDIKKGEKTDLEISITPQGEWHINPDFPFSLKPKSNCFQFDKKKFKKKDLKSASEKKLQFKTSTKCDKMLKASIEGKVVFGVCTDTICKRVSVKLEESVEVK